VIVAIESASTDLSIAVAQPDGTLIADAAWSSEQRQSAELLPRLLELLRQTGNHLDRASAIAIGLGPGSFTGLRVAMSLAKGLALSLGRPLVGVPSLEAWLASEPDATAAVARAGAAEAYALRPGEAAPHIAERDRLPDIVGDRPLVPTELARAFGLSNATPPRGGAAALARLAAERLQLAPGGDDLRTIEPIYLRAPRGVQDAASEGRVTWL
jgi:tRNA threonylcarbamoyl adenosine modification protein YeaZ